MAGSSITSLSVSSASAIMAQATVGKTRAREVIDLATYIGGSVVPTINSLIGRANG